MHVSLDGFVASPHGEMDWIKVDDEIFDHVGKRINKGDTALYGRVTFEMMENYWPTAADQPNATCHDIEHSQWYKEVHKIVLSTTLDEKDFSNTQIISDKIVANLNQIRQSPDGEDILLFGSPTTTHALMQKGLIDGYWLFVNPIILGAGIPLFSGRTVQTRLRLLGTRSFGCGVTELNYVVEEENNA